MMLTTAGKPTPLRIKPRRSGRVPSEGKTAHVIPLEKPAAFDGVAAKARKLIAARPGTCAAVGLIAGGLTGWLTSKLR